MSRIFRENSLGNSKRHNQRLAKTSFVHVHQFSDIISPFAGAAVALSDSELRESAYEILLAAIRSTGTRPLTYIPQSEKASKTQVLTHSPSLLQRSLTSSAASKLKLALGMRSISIVTKACCDVDDSVSQMNVKKSMTIGELVRVQMKVSEQTDSRIRRALLRIDACQLGGRMESMVLPLELLQQLKSSDFPNEKDYNAWRRRTLKLLEAGLLLHPYLPLDKTDNTSQSLQEFISLGLEKDFDTGKNSESMQAFWNVVMSLACRSSDGSVSDTSHWADAFPLNMRIYQLLLDGCFDIDDGAIVIGAIDEVLELIKKTWTVLGINQTLHNLCFLWVLFQHYIVTGQVEDDLLFAANNLLLEVEKDAKATNSNNSRILRSVFRPIFDWAEKRLSAYHEGFNSDNIESMENIISMALTAAKLLEEDVDPPRDRIDRYIRSSLRTAFAQKLDKINLSERLSRHQQTFLPAFAILAQEVSQLAFEEKAIFSPILKRWHCSAAGVAAATLHSCYRDELMQFISSINKVSLDTIQVLVAGDKLEKDLVQIAVEDSVESEDGGKSIIQEMHPYEAEAVTTNLMKTWIETKVDRFEEWVNRNLQQETWNPQANKERVASSVVEVLLVIDETLEAFFLLPIPIHTVLLPDLITGLDKSLQNYILKLKSGCETKSSFIPILPALTRYASKSKFQIFKKKENSHINQNKKPQVGSLNWNDLHEILQLCMRINTLYHIRTQLEVLEKRTILQVRKTESTHGIDSAKGELKGFELSAAACVEEIQQLSEATAYKIVFHELSHVLWDRLYLGAVSSARIEPFLQELEQYLEIIASTVHNKVRLRLITDVMKASFEGFLLVLLAGGPSRAFTIQDCEAIEQDFKLLRDLFWSNGDGLPEELIDKFCVKVKGVISLFRTETCSLIEQFETLVPESQGSAAKSKLPLPPTSGHWSPTEPNTVLRVLCHRRDEIATKFLKKTYNLPKKL